MKSWYGPLLVCGALLFSALSLTPALVHGQSDEPATDKPPAAGTPTEAEWIRSIGIVVSAVAGPGFAVWYAYHMTTVRIPAVEKGHKETIDRMQADHTAEVKRLIDDFRADIKGMWETKRQDDSQLREVLRGLRAKGDPPLI